MSATPAGDAPLARVIGVRALTANIVNNIVGSGIFVLPAAVAAILGPAALLAYVACAVVVGLIALCFAECGSRVAESGGPYTYIEAAFGKPAGLIAGALAWLSLVSGSAAVADVLTGSLAALVPALAAPVPRVIAILVLYALLAALNLRGARPGARVVEAVTLLKIAPLVLLGLVGAWHVSPANFAGLHWPTASALGAGTLALAFAFVGTEGALTPAGELRDPARTVPRAIAAGLLIVAALYGLLQFAAQGVLGAELALQKDAPLAALARAIAGSPGGMFVVACAAISTFGYVAGDALGSPRVLFGLARDGALPRALAYVDPATQAPRNAILAHLAIAAALATTSVFGPLALLSVVAVLVLYAGCSMATLALRRRDVRLATPPFVVPGGATVPVLAFAASVWLMAQATWQEYAACGAVAVVTGAYAAWVQRRTGSGSVQRAPAGMASSTPEDRP
jgi:APA family basic amino acid/polyamine antiporter